MPTVSVCPTCHKTLGANAPAGLCPRCLLGLGLTPTCSFGNDEVDQDNPVRSAGQNEGNHVPSIITGFQTDVWKPSLTEAKPSSRQSIPGTISATPLTHHERDPDAVVGPENRSFGDYELLHEIARGGMGAVYKAIQIPLNRIVAIKVILAGRFASDSEVLRFYSEAKLAAQLDHKNIVPVFEVGQCGDFHFFSMGYVEGGSLAKQLSHGPLAPRAAATVVQTVARAVEYAHDRGVIHRDLKPSNVLIDSSGEPHITDFGVAKRIEEESGLTVAGQILGTPNYMPPEQSLGQPELVRESADVYALGAVLYATLTGRPPFQAATPMETLKQVQEQEPVGPCQLNPSIPRDLETICLKCLEKSPDRRYASARNLADDLQRYLIGEPIHAKPVGPLVRLWKWCQRNTAVASLLMTLLLSLIVGSGVSTYFAIDSSRSASENMTLARERANALGEAQVHQRQAMENAALAEERRIDAEEKAQQSLASATLAEQRRVEAEQEAKRAYRNQYVADMSLARRHWDESRMETLDSVLSRYIPKAGQEDLRGFEWYWWHRMSHQERMALSTEVVLQCVAFSRDGREFAVCGLKPNQLRVRPRVYGVLEIYDVSNVQSGAKLKTSSSHDSCMTSVAYSPDGTRLATSDTSGTIIIRETETGCELLRFKTCDESITDENKSRITDIDYSPDGKLLAIAGWNGTMQVRHVETGELHSRCPKFMGNCFSTRFDPSGEFIAMSSFNTVAVWRLATREIVARLPAYSHCFTLGRAGLAVQQTNPNTTGRRPITIHSLDSNEGTLSAEPVATFDVPGKEVQFFSLEFSPAGDVLVGTGTDRTVYRWDVKTRQLVDILKGHESIVSQMAFSPSDEKLATAELKGSIKLWSPHVTPPFQQRLFEKGRSISDLRFQNFPGVSLSSKSTIPTPTIAVLQPSLSEIHVYDGLQSRPRLEIPTNAAMSRLKMSTDGKRLGMLFTSGVQIWNLDRNVIECQLPISAGKNKLFTLDMSADNRYAAAGGFSGDCHVLNLITKEIELVIPVEGGVRNIGFSPDGVLLGIFSGEQVLSVWNIKKKCEVWKRSYSSKIWGNVVRSDDGRKAHILYILSNFAFSNDGLQLAVTMNDDKVRVHQSATGDVQTEFDAQGIEVLEFTPDGTRLASYGSDRTVKVWDVKTGREILVLQTDQDRLTQLEFVDDGRRLMGIGLTGVYSWETRPVSNEVVEDSVTTATSESP